MEKEGMFKELVENSGDVIVVTDKSFVIRYVSSSARDVFGVDPVSLLGRNAFRFIESEKRILWEKQLEEKETVFDTVGITTASDHVLYFDVQVSNLLDRRNVEGLVIRLHDVTGQKEREEELLLSNQQLDQVLFKTTHDLKAPLVSALGLINLAERASEENRLEYLKLIKKSLLKLDAMIEEMNVFFRHEKLAVRREPIDIRSLFIDETEHLDSLYKEKNIEIRFSLSGEGDFYSDSIRVRTIVSNILSNAIKYYDPQKNKPFINISVTLNEDICVIEMQDNGIGISPEHQAKIFDLFYRATDQSSGTGLGLFIVKDTVNRLKGTIEVKSVLKQGTSFLIKIPNQTYQPFEVE